MGAWVDGDSVRWIGVSRFPAIQLANGSGSDGLASCRIAVVASTSTMIAWSTEARYSSTARPARDRRQTRVGLDAIAVTGVRLDQAGVDGKALTADQSGVDAALHVLHQVL